MGRAVGSFEGGKVCTFVVGMIVGRSVGSFEGGKVGTFVVGMIVGRAVGSFEGGKVGTFVVGMIVGRAVGSFEGGKVGAFVVGMIVVGGIEGIEVCNAVSVSHQMRSLVPDKTTSAISSSVPPVPKYPMPFFKKHPFEGKSPT